jgi:hypothetical protein
MLVRHDLLADEGEMQNAHAGASSAQAHNA